MANVQPNSNEFQVYREARQALSICEVGAHARGGQPATPRAADAPIAFAPMNGDNLVGSATQKEQESVAPGSRWSAKSKPGAHAHYWIAYTGQCTDEQP